MAEIKRLAPPASELRAEQVQIVTAFRLVCTHTRLARSAAIRQQLIQLAGRSARRRSNLLPVSGEGANGRTLQVD